MHFALGESSWRENNNDDSLEENGKVQWQSDALPYANGRIYFNVKFLGRTHLHLIGNCDGIKTKMVPLKLNPFKNTTRLCTA
jgi:hypothetical protein